jgi:chromosome segregation ATPase
LEAQTKVIQQLQSDLAQANQDMTRLRQSNGRLTQEKMQMEHDKALLQQKLDKRTAELAAAREQIAAAASSHAERLIIVKREKIDAVADAHGSAQQAAKAAAGKRKAETELESEAKRRRALEGKLTALAEQMDEKDKCAICLDKQPNVLLKSCKHLVCCGGCADTMAKEGGARATCPNCTKPFRAKDIIQVCRT